MNTILNHQSIFHIGLPKAASTTLQKKLFPHLDNVNNFALYPTNNVAGANVVEESANSIYLQDKRLFEFYKSLHNRPEIGINELRSMWSALFDEYAVHATSILSHEAVTSAFFSAIPVPEKLARVKALFPSAKIVIVVREQQSWLHSQYTDHPFEPLNLGNGAPCSFDYWVTQFLSHPKLEPARNALDYASLVKKCIDMWGVDNVTVIAFEWLIQSSSQFYSSWAKLFGISHSEVGQLISNRVENRGLSASYNRLRQRQRRHKLARQRCTITQSLLEKDSLKSLPKAVYCLSGETQKLLNDFYADSNNELKEIMGWES